VSVPHPKNGQLAVPQEKVLHNRYERTHPQRRPNGVRQAREFTPFRRRREKAVQNMLQRLLPSRPLHGAITPMPSS
jgi:hypothetical protein